MGAFTYLDAVTIYSFKFIPYLVHSLFKVRPPLVTHTDIEDHHGYTQRHWGFAHILMTSNLFLNVCMAQQPTFPAQPPAPANPPAEPPADDSLSEQQSLLSMRGGQRLRSEMIDQGFGAISTLRQSFQAGRSSY